MALLYTFCGLLTLRGGTITSFIATMLIFCLQNGQYVSRSAGIGDFPLHDQICYVMPLIFLIAAGVGIYGVIKYNRMFLIPALAVIAFAVLNIIWGFFAKSDGVPVHKRAHVFRGILIIPFAYFWVIIFSYFQELNEDLDYQDDYQGYPDY